MLLCITILTIVYGGLIKNPAPRYIDEKIPNGNYTRQAQEVFTLYYGAYPGIFAIDLHKRINGDINQQSINLNDFQKVEEEYEGQYGCFAIQRNIEITFQIKLWLDKTGVTRDIYFTDIATSEATTRIYVVRNDFTLFQVDLSRNLLQVRLHPQEQSFAKLLDYDEDDPDNFPYLVDDIDQNRIYIITKNGGASVNTNQTLGEAQIILENAVLKRDKIYNVHYTKLHQLIFVACGYEGIDVYIVKESKLKLLNHLTTAQLGIPYGQVIDIDSDGKEMLYVLDKETGLRFYHVYSPSSGGVSFLFNIQITNAKNFDHFESTFFIVAKTVNKQDYVAEIFVNEHTHDYFFNNYYIDEMTINDVNVFEHYAVLIGDDGHKIIFHSIYEGFLDESLISHTSFQEPDLFKVKEYDFEDKQFSNTRFLVGIAKYEFKFLEIRMNYPIIKCIIEEPEINQYYVSINSTDCEGKPESVLDQQLTLCNITHLFSYTTTEASGNYHTYAYYTLVIYVLFVIIVWLVVFGYVCLKKWGHKLSWLTWRKKRIDASAPYNESFDVKDTEMASQQQQQPNK